MALRIMGQGYCPVCKTDRIVVLYHIKAGVEGYGCKCRVCDEDIVVSELVNIRVALWSKDEIERHKQKKKR